MFSIKGIASFALGALLFSGSHAAPHFQSSRLSSRDDASSSSNSDSTGTSLEPVVPPDVDESALDILALDQKVTLAWAGSTSASGSKRKVKRDGQKLKRDGGILSSASLTFKYPAVPLDHSTYVSDVSCSGGSLTGTLSDAAYAYAKKQWTGASDILFVTSVAGCGMDDANELFHATAITLSDSDKSFTAQGSSTSYKESAQHMNLQWGDVGTLKLKRAVDKRDMFEPHPLHKRAELDVSVHWGAWLQDDDFLGEDEDAPWEGSALLWKWGKEDGEEDDSYKKGEVADPSGHHKRSTNVTSLQTRELDYGLALYCVECGFGGYATIWGEIDADIFPWPSINTIQAGFRAGFSAGLNLGMVAFVKYERDWIKTLATIHFGGFYIPLLVDVGPFASVSVDAGVEISATGSLLIGASVDWDAIDIMFDLLDPDNSYAEGFDPVFSHKAEAAGELKMEAHLGLPLKLGLEIDIVEGLWSADAAIVDTPKIVAEGSFEVSATVTDDGTIEHDINGGCYGIAWDVHFENTLEAVLEADLIGEMKFPLMDPWVSEPIAEGCIGYVDDGTEEDPNDDDSEGTGSQSGAGGNGMNSGGTGLSGNNSNDDEEDDGSSSTSTTSTSTTSTSTSTSSSTTTTSTSTSTPAFTRTTTSTPSSTTTTAPTCTPTQAIVNPKIPSGATCRKIAKQAKVAEKFNVGDSVKTKTLELCAAKCLKSSKCVSFGYDGKKECQMYNKRVASIGIMTKRDEPTITFYDKGCFAYKACSK